MDGWKQGKAYIVVCGKRWKNNETPGSGEQYGRGRFTIRSCGEGGAPSWRLFGPYGIDLYDASPRAAVLRLEAIKQEIASAL